MERAEVSAEIAAPAAALWDLFRWDNPDAALAAGLFAGVDYEERRPLPGATRSVALNGGGTVREQLVSVDEAAMSYRYTVLNLADFPLEHYLGGVTVTPLDGGRSRLTFACDFLPRGIGADQWREVYSAMQAAFIAFARANCVPASGVSS
jgi:hypothetical protein